MRWDFTKNKMRHGKYITKSGIDYVVNTLGFRGKEFEPFTKSGYRIICFGGSSTLGLESSEKDTYPAQLGQMLKEQGIKAEVLNFGFPAKSLTFIQELFFNEAINYKPDLITIYSNRNTILYDSPRSKSAYVEVIYGRHNNLLKRIAFNLYDNSMIYRFAIVIKNKISNYYIKVQIIQNLLKLISEEPV
jgi:hypothetical protein